MADVNLYPVEPKKVIGEYTEFFAGQLPTANDFNRWLAVLIAQGDYNTAWLDLVSQKAGVSINELYAELSVLSEIVTPGSGTLFSQRLATLETNAGGWKRYALVTDIDATLNLSTTTMFQIVNKMTNFSLFTTAIDTSTSLANTDIPTEVAGLLDIIKVNGRAILRFTQYNGNTWERVCALTSTESTMTAWYKIVNNNEITAWNDITSQVGKNFFVSAFKTLYNPTTKEVKITVFCDVTTIPNEGLILELPLICRPTMGIQVFNGALAKKDTSLAISDWNPILIGVNTDGSVRAHFSTGTGVCYLQGTFSYIAV